MKVPLTADKNSVMSVTDDKGTIKPAGDKILQMIRASLSLKEARYRRILIGGETRAMSWLEIMSLSGRMIEGA